MGRAVLVAVFGDAHAHAEALDAAIGAAEAGGAEELWWLGDMTAGGRIPSMWWSVRASAARSRRWGPRLRRDGLGRAEPLRRAGLAGGAVISSPATGSGPRVAWMRSRKPRRRRGEVQCWHGGPRMPCRYVGASNAGACLAVQRGRAGAVGETDVAAAWRDTSGARAGSGSASANAWTRRREVAVNPGAVGAAAPARLGWWDALDPQAADGAYWPLLDLERRMAPGAARRTTRPGAARARALGLDD